MMEYLLHIREKEANKDIAERTEEMLPLGLIGEMMELDAVRFVVTRMKVTLDDKPPGWTELQAAIECFTQIVSLTIEVTYALASAH
jgi:replication fork protection complex subunit Tof1/Swi1